jgi:hypothetical protein
LIHILNSCAAALDAGARVDNYRCVIGRTDVYIVWPFGIGECLFLRGSILSSTNGAYLAYNSVLSGKQRLPSWKATLTALVANWARKLTCAHREHCRVQAASRQFPLHSCGLATAAHQAAVAATAAAAAVVAATVGSPSVRELHEQTLSVGSVRPQYASSGKRVSATEVTNAPSRMAKPSSGLPSVRRSTGMERGTLTCL